MNIIDDFLPENSEFFNANVGLTRPEDASIVVIGNPKQPLIEIQDLRNSEWLTAQLLHNYDSLKDMYSTHVKVYMFIQWYHASCLYCINSCLGNASLILQLISCY